MNLGHLNEKNVARVYSGKVGCMCGCRGTYYDKPKAIKMLIRRMKEAIQLYRFDKEGDYEENNQYIYIEIPKVGYRHGRYGRVQKIKSNRCYCAYFKED